MLKIFIILNLIFFELPPQDVTILKKIDRNQKRLCMGRVNICNRHARKSYKFIIRVDYEILSNALNYLNENFKESGVTDLDNFFIVQESFGNMVWCYLWNEEDIYYFCKDPREKNIIVEKKDKEFLLSLPEARMIQSVNDWGPELNSLPICNSNTVIDGTFVIATRVFKVNNKWKVKSKFFAEFH